MFFTKIFAAFALSAAFLTAACTAQQTEEQALENLRQMTRSGRQPSEDMVAAIESRFAGKRTGALAKLLRAKMHFDSKDFAGTASILRANDIAKHTKLGDYALWMYGRSLQETGDHANAAAAFERLEKDFPDSIWHRQATLARATSLLATDTVKAPKVLKELLENNDVDALLIAARSYEALGIRDEAAAAYRKVYFYGAGTDAAKEAETRLTSFYNQQTTPLDADEALTRADVLFAAKDYAGALKAYQELADKFPSGATPRTRLRQLTAAAESKKMADAQSAFDSLPSTAAEREEGYYQLALGYAKARLWPDARRVAEEMRQKYPSSELTPKAWVAAGLAARDARNKAEETYFLRSAFAAFPKAIDVAGAQFELAWLEHEAGNFDRSSQMFTEHLERYVDRDTTNRGKAGYWAARDSERAGKIAEACALYNGVLYRYSANWYGYMADQRLTAMKGQGKCRTEQLPNGSNVPKAVANLKIVTVAPERSSARELKRIDKSEDLSTVGLFDWAVAELQDAKKSAQDSPKINLALAQFYRLKGDNVNALLALAKSYPDYSQMFPEEMGREEWEIFYPLSNWDQIKLWAKNRNLDQYQVAGLIRQESVFNPRAKSGANAYGLMQLIVPTARTLAKKYGSATTITGESLFDPALNIELGTAYMRDQLDKFGRIEYMAVAYNAGPGRVPQWRASLPLEIDDFVEEIPFRETKGYVQGVIRNSAQYRRLYDDNGNFKPNVGKQPLRSAIDGKSKEQLAAEFPDIQISE